MDPVSLSKTCNHYHFSHYRIEGGKILGFDFNDWNYYLLIEASCNFKVEIRSLVLSHLINVSSHGISRSMYM